MRAIILKRILMGYFVVLIGLGILTVSVGYGITGIPFSLQAVFGSQNAFFAIELYLLLVLLGSLASLRVIKRVKLEQACAAKPNT